MALKLGSRKNSKRYKWQNSYNVVVIKVIKKKSVEIKERKKKRKREGFFGKGGFSNSFIFEVTMGRRAFSDKKKF